MGQATAPVSVLLVEDEILISNLVADWLSERGFAVHELATADEALRYIEEGGAVDVLFTDVNLPGKIDGAELAQRARAAAGPADRLCLGPRARDRPRRPGAALDLPAEAL